MNLYLLLSLMVLATYRLTRLVTTDTFPPVLLIRDIVAGGWRPAEEGETPTDTVGGVPSVYHYRAQWSPAWLGELITCPWCASAYVSAAVVGASWAMYGLPAPVLVWLGVWALGALISAQEWA